MAVLRLSMLMILATACSGLSHKTWQSSIVQPKLRLGSTQEARTSYEAVIKMKDMDLPRFCKKRRWVRTDCWDMSLKNKAYFVVVSRDRMRFHVTLNHKWETMSDPARWRVWIEDDLGRKFYPEAVDRYNVRPVTKMWSTRGTDHKTPMFSLTVWRGDGDYVFYRRGLFREDMTRMRLVMQRPGYEFHYTWRFIEINDEGDVVGVLEPAPPRK